MHWCSEDAVGLDGLIHFPGPSSLSRELKASVSGHTPHIQDKKRKHPVGSDHQAKYRMLSMPINKILSGMPINTIASGMLINVIMTGMLKNVIMTGMLKNVIMTGIVINVIMTGMLINVIMTGMLKM